MSVKDVTIELNSDPELLCVVRDAVRSYLHCFEVSDDRIQEVVLAVDEVCSNAIRHAYKGEPGHVYSLSMTSDAGWFEFIVRDDGIPAPKRVVEEKPAPQSLDDVTVGGYGIQIVRQVCDEVTFETRKPQGNLVTVKVKCA